MVEHLVQRPGPDHVRSPGRHPARDHHRGIARTVGEQQHLPADDVVAQPPVAPIEHRGERQEQRAGVDVADQRHRFDGRVQIALGQERPAGGIVEPQVAGDQLAHRLYRQRHERAVQRERVGAGQHLARFPAGAPAVVEQRLIDRLLVAAQRVAPLHAGGVGTERPEEIVDVARRVAGGRHVDLQQRRVDAGAHGYRACALGELRGRCRVVAGDVRADHHAALGRAIGDGQQRQHGQQRNHAARAGVLDLKGGDALRHRAAGILQHPLDVGGDRLAVVDGRLRADRQIAQVGQRQRAPRQQPQGGLRGHRRAVLPPRREAHLLLLRVLEGALERHAEQRIFPDAAADQRAHVDFQRRQVQGDVADTDDGPGGRDHDASSMAGAATGSPSTESGAARVMRTGTT